MTGTKVGELYAELGIVVDPGMLAKAQRSLDAFEHHVRSIEDPNVSVRVRVDDGRMPALVADLHRLDATKVDAEVDVDTRAAEEHIERVRKASFGLGDTLKGLAIGAGFKWAIDQSSELNESVNVTGLAFGELRGEIDEFVKGAAKIGYSEAEARKLTASVGALLENMGLARGETVEWSKELLQMGADIGSALDGNPAEVVEAIGAAIRGETGNLSSFESARFDFERDYLAKLLKITNGNVTQAARLAKRNRTEFYKLLQRHHLNPSMFKPGTA